ncbi:tRNA-splicing endonuclease subunit sen54 N-term-domain-containing protein, partial [Infundibulicybe gibba]
MDDSLERPSALPQKAPLADPVDDADESSGDEDGGLDWTKLVPNAARPVIPKRGEKDFEPAPGGGSGLQLHVLDRARSAMFETLRATRTTSSKSISYAIWHPSLARAEVLVARGVHFAAMGHSVPRPTLSADGTEKVHKRLELLPEETIYLVERGTLFCWKESPNANSDDVPGAPMSVQQAYSEMIGTEDLTLDKFQTARIHGNESQPSHDAYPTPPSIRPMNTPAPSFLRRHISSWIHRLSRVFLAALFRSLRFIPAGHHLHLQSCNTKKQEEVRRQTSPYQIFYNIYKPSTPFKKSAPPAPDFQVVVVNARTTPMPSIHELTDLFDASPELPPPMPRQRKLPPSQPAPRSTAPAPAHPQSSVWQLFSWALPKQPVPDAAVMRKPNPFMALKAGKKMVIIAVVDAGNLGFFKFGQGEFTEWPMF